MSYETIVTTAGRQALSTAIANNQPLPIDSFKVGDGGGAVITPSESATDVVNACYTGTPARLSVPDSTGNQVAIECVVPASSGGYTVREIGIYSNNTLICYAATPEIEKPLLESGAVGDLILTVTMSISNVSAVTLEVDPGVAVATRQYVDRKMRPKDGLLDQLRMTAWGEVNGHTDIGSFRGIWGTQSICYVATKINENNKFYVFGLRGSSNTISTALAARDYATIKIISNNIVILTATDNNTTLYFPYEIAPLDSAIDRYSYQLSLSAFRAYDVALGIGHYVLIGDGAILDYVPSNSSVPWNDSNCSKHTLTTNETDSFTSIAYSSKLNKFCAIGYQKEISTDITYSRHCYTFSPGADSLGNSHNITSLTVSQALDDETVGKIVWSERDECFVAIYQGETNVYYSRDGETWYSFAPSTYNITNITADNGIIVWYYNYAYFLELPKILDGSVTPYICKKLSITSSSGGALNISITRSAECFDGSRWWRGGGNKLVVSLGGGEEI